MKTFLPFSKLIGEFTPSGYPVYDKNNGVTHNMWKSNLLNITRVGVANITKFVRDSGFKGSKFVLSKSWLVMAKNKNYIQAEIKRRNDEAALHAVNASTSVITADAVKNNNDIVSNVHEENCDDMEDINDINGDASHNEITDDV